MAAFGVALLGMLFVSDDANAAEPTPVVVMMNGEGHVRLEVSAGTALPCDSSANAPLFDGWIDGGQVFTATTTEACVCRKQICRGRICRPAPDQTIRVKLSTDG